MQYAYCSNKNCDYHQYYGESDSKKRPSERPMPVEPEKYCGKCGYAMIHIPSCGHPRKTMDKIFCQECGKPYK